MTHLSPDKLPGIRASLMVGGAAFALAITGALVGRDGAAFCRAYLFAYIFWLGISLGSMGILMMYHLTGGNWGRLTSRISEAASLTLPLMLLLFVPIAFGARQLYPWANPDAVAADPVLQHKEHVFNIAAVVFRAIVSLGLWSLLAGALRWLSVARDRQPKPRYGTLFSALSGLGMVFYFLTMTSAAIDWIMSREPHWYSTVFGIVVIMGQALSACCFMIVVLWAMRKDEAIAPAIHPETLNDLGNLLLMFVIFWAYVSFAQLLVTWMGNTQEEVTWYYQRVRGGWQAVSIALIALHFFVPFLLLLGQQNKRRIGVLGALAVGLLALRLLDAAYLVLPTSTTELPLPISWLDFVTPIGIGGVWMACFRWNLSRQPLLVRVAEETTGRSHAERSNIATT
jgi:hypothetical protein